MSCGPASMAESATRPHGANCVAVCPLVLFGVRPTAKSAFIPTRRSSPLIRSVFARFAEMGSARRVWLWFRSEGLKFPLQMHAHSEIRWVEASYTAIHQVLTNPVYAGAYVYGRTPPGDGSRRLRRAQEAPSQVAAL